MAGGQWSWVDNPGNLSPTELRAARPPTAPDIDLNLPSEWVGKRGALFGLALKSGVLTVLTLGMYRFWMKTRLRRWYWSSIRPGGVPMEYTGEPVEKLLGFLMAVVILSFYIGIVNLFLMFLSFSLLSSNFAAYAASLIGVIPLWFYAGYRARRYILARTRWAGIRFGVDKGAWGYAGRALLHWGITILTLGLLWPRMTFALEKYKTDRTWFGTAKMEQGGRWQMLYRPFLAVVLPGVATVIVSFVGLLGEKPETMLVFLLLGPWLGYAIVHYQVSATRLLANHKTVGTVGLLSQARSGRVMGIYTLGYFLTVLGILALFGIAAMAFGLFMAATGTYASDFSGVGLTNQKLVIFAGVVAYFSVFLSWSVLRHVFVTMPVWKHYAETLTLTHAAGLRDIRQRARDEMAEAEGFAEALDLGAAI